MRITPDPRSGASRTGRLEEMTVEAITERLGFAPNVADDHTKVKHSWGFKVEGAPGYFGIWDYKMSHLFGQFSTYGDAATLEKLFGSRYHDERKQINAGT